MQTSKPTSIAKAIRELEAYPETLNELTPLVHPRLAQAVIDEITAAQRPCDTHETQRLAQQLLGFYPAREVNDAKTYVAGITALMAAYPIEFVKRVCDPVTGLPSELKWLPTLKEVKDALELHRKRREKILLSAQWTIREAARREAARLEEEEFQRARGTAEQRAARAHEILKNARLNAL